MVNGAKKSTIKPNNKHPILILKDKLGWLFKKKINSWLIKHKHALGIFHIVSYYFDFYIKLHVSFYWFD